MMTGTKRLPDGGVKAVAGVSTPLKCGSPLQLHLTSQSTRVATQGFLSFGQADKAQSIQASILGSGGESYSVPYLVGRQGARQPSAPAFSVLTADGKLADSGDLEYG